MIRESDEIHDEIHDRIDLIRDKVSALEADIRLKNESTDIKFSVIRDMIQEIEDVQNGILERLAALGG